MSKSLKDRQIDIPVAPDETEAYEMELYYVYDIMISLRRIAEALENANYLK